MTHIPPLRLILSGGGVRGLSYVGCFLELERKNLLKKVNEILGVSCGALFGFAFSIGYSPSELNEFVELFDFTLMQHVEPEIVFDFLQTYGVDNGANYERLIESIIKQKGLNKDLTFKEHYDSTRIIDAIMASSSIPGYFIPKTIDNITYVDGGIINNFPINLLTFQEIKNTLGFAFSEEHITIDTIPTISTFLNQIYTCFYITNKKSILNLYKNNIVIVSCGDYPMWNFHVSYEDKLKLLEIFRKSVENFYNLKQFTRKPVRRYSVS